MKLGERAGGDGQAELVHREGLEWNQTQHCADSLSVSEDIYTESRESFDLESEVAVVVSVEVSYRREGHQLLEEVEDLFLLHRRKI